jgi:PleD family two-component response regulator
MPTRQAQEFITQGEMQEVEERVKRRWKTLLVLLALALKVPVEHAVRPAPAAEPIALWAKVLLIGGDMASAAEISAALGQAGLNVISAADRQESLAKLAEANLVILDEESPDVAETCSYIREELNLPIIIIGSDASDSAWDRAVSMGADAYMRRFANRSEMVARIKAILRRYHSSIDTLAEKNDV